MNIPLHFFSAVDPKISKPVHVRTNSAVFPRVALLKKTLNTHLWSTVKEENFTSLWPRFLFAARYLNTHLNKLLISAKVVNGANEWLALITLAKAPRDRTFLPLPSSEELTEKLKTGLQFS